MSLSAGDGGDHLQLFNADAGGKRGCALLEGELRQQFGYHPYFPIGANLRSSPLPPSPGHVVSILLLGKWAADVGRCNRGFEKR